VQLDLTSFLRSGIPVQHYRDWRNVGALNWDIHQKPLSIQGNGVLLSLSARRNFHKVGREQRHRDADLERLPTGFGLDGDGHPLAIARDVEEFLPITVPLRVRATGHPKFAIWHLDQGTAGRKSFS
jgi:hypothetical protein